MKSDYEDETVEDYEARPPGRSAVARPARVRRHKRERWRRIAEGSQPAVISRDGYAFSPHSRERENSRRLMQQERRQ
jgi:hypothetical protein